MDLAASSFQFSLHADAVPPSPPGLCGSHHATSFCPGLSQTNGCTPSVSPCPPLLCSSTSATHHGRVLLFPNCQRGLTGGCKQLGLTRGLALTYRCSQFWPGVPATAPISPSTPLLLSPACRTTATLVMWCCAGYAVGDG